MVSSFTQYATRRTNAQVLIMEAGAKIDSICLLHEEYTCFTSQVNAYIDMKGWS